MNLYDAIVQSCNVYFYELGARPGMMDRLAKFGADLGLGAPTGLGLNGEEGGFLPTEEWYREQKRKNPKAEGFQIGQSLNAVIGQGSTRVTLLQMATLYAAIANGGKLWLPQIVERVESPEGKMLEEFPPRVRRELAVSPETLATVRQALVGVVNEPKGTAYRARLDDIEVAGKTGTAQVPERPRRGRLRERHPRLVRRLRAGRAARRSPSRCWSSTAATAATSPRRWRWRSSTTTSRPSRRPIATRPTSGVRAGVSRARPNKASPGPAGAPGAAAPPGAAPPAAPEAPAPAPEATP